MTEAHPAKSDLRRRLRARRDVMPLVLRTQASDAIRRQVLDLPQIAAADSVFCYVSFGSEVDTHDLIRSLLAAGKRVAVPRLTGPGAMIAQPIGALEELVPGLYGFLQPPAELDVRHHPCPVTVAPGLAFTAHGDRLGYGAGHYDRYFARHRDTFAVGLCFHEQIEPSLPTELHDRRMDLIVTERPAALC